MPKKKSKPRSTPTGRLREIPLGLPPGIVVDRYELTDLREYDADSGAGGETHSVVVWTTLRDRLIDRWLDVERILRSAGVILLSPTDDLRPRIWTLMSRQSGEALIDLLADLLSADGSAVPTDFKPSLKALVGMRNLLAHLSSRPRESKVSTGLVFLRSVGFKEGVYVEASFDDIERAMSDVRPVMDWLLAELPDSDGVSVQMEDEVFDLLEARKNPFE